MHLRSSPVFNLADADFKAVVICDHRTMGNHFQALKGKSHQIDNFKYRWGNYSKMNGNSGFKK